MLTLLALTTIAAPHALGQAFCTLKRHFPNYMASVDGYAPADYDGDGLADWSIKDFSGAWTIDYSSNGFNGYDQTFFGYGGQNNLPVPHDYDGDGKADLSIKSSTQGRWNIDYAANGYGVWDASFVGYGGAENIPVPAHYGNDDLKADLAVWTESGPFAGTFNIDLSGNGFGTWDVSHRNRIPGPGRPAAGDFNGDSFLDFSVKRNDGVWVILFHQPINNFGPCSPSGFLLGGLQSFAGYGDAFHRPVPHHYSTFFPVGGAVANANTDLAVRRETAPFSVAMDFVQNGLGTWDFVYSP